MSPGSALAFLMPRLPGEKRLSVRHQAHPRGAWQGWGWRYRCLALERTLDELSNRLAHAEIALLREERTSQQARQRLAEAESALVRVQSTLDALRQSEAGPPKAGLA